jgi:hypothetical protein
MLFSYRKGIKKVREAVQLSSLDEVTRNLLWSALCEFYWNYVQTEQIQFRGSTGRFFRMRENEPYNTFFRNYWLYYLRRPIDEFDNNWPSFRSSMREHFFSADWNEVFDYLEFVYANVGIYQRTDALIEAHNNIFEREKVPYRVLKGRIVDITSPAELQEVDQALGDKSEPVRVHLETAASFLFDRTSPNYRNSVKEAISAVEALCKEIAGKDKATLSEAVKVLSATSKYHPAFLSALDKLYGYTSDSSGIRHSLLESDRVDYADAKFMLLACSSFVNYVRTKSAK